MKRKKLDLKIKYRNDIYSSGIINVSKEDGEYFFEIGSELTSDIGEAVAIMMRKIDWNDIVWDLELENMELDNITPEKSLFWLTGGHTEWKNLDNYNTPWYDCYLEFQEEFGLLVVDIVKDSNTLRDVRNLFIKKLNLTILYDFALSKNMIKL